MTNTEGQKRVRSLGLALLSNVAWETGLMATTPTDFYAQLSSDIGGWQKAREYATYTPENLSDYIDGAAELFISFNFQRGLSVKYLKDANPDITVDIFDMSTSHDAFGVFAHSREGTDTRVGQGCEYSAGLLTFWQDRFYVSILAYPETPEKRELVFKLGREIAAGIERQGALPPIIALLPSQGLIPESVRYFHHYIWLNSSFYLSDQNLLDIGPATPSALGRYRHPRGSYFVLLVGFPSQSQAQAAASKLRTIVLGGVDREAVRMPDGTWAGHKLNGTVLSAVFKAPDEHSVRDALAGVKKPEPGQGGPE